MEKTTAWAKTPQYITDCQWKEWTYKKLPSSANFWVTDIDGMIRTRNGCIALVEIKRRGQSVPVWQQMSYGLLAATLENSQGSVLKHEYLPYDIAVNKFLGIVELIFENTWFNDGEVYLSINGMKKQVVTEPELIEILSFEKDCCICYPPHTCDCACS